MYKEHRLSSSILSKGNILTCLTLVVLFVIRCVAVEAAEGKIVRSEESVLDVPPVPLLLEKPPGWIFPPKYVEAGYFPTYVVMKYTKVTLWLRLSQRRIEKKHFN